MGGLGRTQPDTDCSITDVLWLPRTHFAAEFRDLLERCASTTLSSKLVSQHKEYFAKLCVDAVMTLDTLLPLNMIGIKKVQGGGLEVMQPKHAVLVSPE